MVRVQGVMLAVVKNVCKGVDLLRPFVRAQLVNVMNVGHFPGLHQSKGSEREKNLDECRAGRSLGCNGHALVGAVGGVDGLACAATLVCG